MESGPGPRAVKGEGGGGKKRDKEIYSADQSRSLIGGKGTTNRARYSRAVQGVPGPMHRRKLGPGMADRESSSIANKLGEEGEKKGGLQSPNAMTRDSMIIIKRRKYKAGGEKGKREVGVNTGLSQWVGHSGGKM